MTISSRCGWLTWVATLLLAPWLYAADQYGAERPNIVFILSDDQGWGDVGYRGSQIKTPNIDRLAADGVRLEQFYVQPLCSPTRAAFLTGRYPIRYGLQVGVVRPHARYGLPAEERTLPEALRDAGYRTAMAGKWHLGHIRREFLPTGQGFEHHYGLYTGNFDYFTHRRDGGLDWHRNEQPVEEPGYSTELIADEAARLITEHDPRRPLFLYVAFNAPHMPLQVPENYSALYKDWPERRRLYAGIVTAMDEGVGRIVSALEKSGLRSNTLLVFSSDNGGALPGLMTDNGPLREGKGTYYEGGVRVPALAVWDGKLPAGAAVDAPLHIVDWFPTLLKLAGASLDQPLPLDGRDMWSSLAAGAPSPHEELLINVGVAGGAIRVGDWKLVLNGKVKDGLEGGTETDERREMKRRARLTPQIELFNLADDPFEKTNLAASRPDQVARLQERLDTYGRAAVPSKQAPAAPGFKTPAVWGAEDGTEMRD
ncbi:MAG TPA: arylsulfatase [Opitutus sp.]|nr:arylsulfatase [Opitutus sp.]